MIISLSGISIKKNICYNALVKSDNKKHSETVTKQNTMKKAPTGPHEDIIFTSDNVENMI